MLDCFIVRKPISPPISASIDTEWPRDYRTAIGYSLGFVEWALNYPLIGDQLHVAQVAKPRGSPSAIMST